MVFDGKMRDKLIHWYFEIDEEIVWNVARMKLPEIKSGSTGLLKNYHDFALFLIFSRSWHF